MKFVFIDDDESTNFYHQIILDEYLNDNTDIEYHFYDEPMKAFEALKVADHQPTYIFLDLNMPVMDGWEFLDAYSALEIDHARVIILTTSRNSLHINKSKSYGIVSAYKSKPLTQEILEEVLQGFETTN